MNARFHHQRFNHDNAAGYTLIEALMVLAVAGILMAAAIPSMQSLISKNRLATAVNDFIGDFHLARSEAVKRQLPTVLCPSSDGTHCSGDSAWQSGWILFVDDRISNRLRDAEEEIVRVYSALPQGYTVISSRSRIAFQINGQTSGFNTTLSFCHDGDEGKAVIVSNEGRIRVGDTDEVRCK